VRVDRVYGPLHAGLAVLAVVFALMLPTVSGAAGEATPVAENPELEARVQALSRNLRCLVCQNESVAESRAPLAVDLRAQVRDQLGSGKSESDVIDFMVSRYGDFVLYKPPFKASTALLWLGPVVLLVGGLGWLLLRLRSREREAPLQLTEDERKRARALLEGAPADSEEQHS
jgi:cytochrome c-type biogenesis protein CcmH